MSLGVKFLLRRDQEGILGAQKEKVLIEEAAGQRNSSGLREPQRPKSSFIYPESLFLGNKITESWVKKSSEFLVKF